MGKTGPSSDRDMNYKVHSTNKGQVPALKCKAYGRKTLLSSPVRLHSGTGTQAVDLFSRIANKSPVRGTARGARSSSAANYYPILYFIHGRC